MNLSKRITASVAFCLLTFAAVGQEGPAGAPSPAALMQKATPLLMTDDVRACADFWTRLGLRVTAEIPGEGGPTFAMLANDRLELMYQSRASARAETPDIVAGIERSFVYVEVESLDTILERLGSAEVIVPERRTDYGAREIYVRDPAGNVIGFAEQNAPE